MSIVVVAPLNAGFLAGADRYDYRGKMPEGFPARRFGCFAREVSFIETWIDETERRTWFLFETCRAVEPEALSA